VAEPAMTFREDSAPPPGDDELAGAMMVLGEMSPEELERLKEEAEQKAKAMAEMLSTLAGSIESKFQDRSSRRSVKEAEWIDSYRLYLGPLSAGNRQSTPAQFFEGSKAPSRPIEHNLVKQKCKTAVAQGISAQFAGGDKNWDLVPSPSPDVDMVLAAVAAEAMEQEIEDQLNNTNYGEKSRQAYEDRVVLGTGILKGPLPSRFAELTYDLVPDPETGQPIPVPVHRVKNKPILFRVDPWFFFPDDTVNDIDDAEDAIELHPMSKTQLIKLKQNPGFFAEALDELLEEECREYTNPTFTEYASLTASGSNVFRNKYAVLEYHGPITKDQLGMLDIEPSYDAENETYFGEVWVCQGKVLRVELEALAGTFELPYAVCTWLPDPGSIFGFGLPQECRDPQRMANTALQMMLKNASDSSGSIFVINSELVDDPEGTYQFRPGKILLTTDYTITSMDQVIKDYTVPNVTGNIMPIFQLARELGQEESGTPMLAAGLESPTAGSDSATGLAIIDQNSTTVSDFYSGTWSDKMTEKLIRRWYHYNMQFVRKPETLGDFEVDVRSSQDLRQNQLQVRDMEKLSVETGQNPEVAKVIKIANLTKARLAMMHIPKNMGIVKTDAELLAEEQAAAENPKPDPMMLELQLKQQELELKGKEIEQKNMMMQLEFQKMQFEMTANQQREAWEHEERMTANVMRGQEAQARVLEAQLIRETEMYKLAAKEGMDHASILADIEKTNKQEEVKLFLGGQKAQTEFAKIQLTKDEMEFAKNSPDNDGV
jgi:hypothetical protein